MLEAGVVMTFALVVAMALFLKTVQKEPIALREKQSLGQLGIVEMLIGIGGAGMVVSVEKVVILIGVVPEDGNPLFPMSAGDIVMHQARQEIIIIQTSR